MSQYITIPLSKYGKNRGKYEAIVDIIDSDLAELEWAVKKSLHTQYACRRLNGRKSNKILRLHRVIMSRKLERELLSNEDVDHIDGNGLNNTRDNLRLATPSQNGANSRKVKGIVPYKGVTLDKRRNMYNANIIVNRKKIYLGSFDNPEDAHQAYCEKAKELFGEYARFD